MKKPVKEKKQPANLPPKQTVHVASERGFKTIMRKNAIAVFLLLVGASVSVSSIVAVYLALHVIEMTHTLKVQGVLQAIEQATPVSHARGGVISNVFVTEGEVVREGQILASLSTQDVAEELLVARQSVAGALLRSQCLRALRANQSEISIPDSLKQVMGRLQQVKEMERAEESCQSELNKRKLDVSLANTNLRAVEDVAMLYGRVTQTDILMRQKLGGLSPAQQVSLVEDVKNLGNLRGLLEDSIKAAQAKQEFANAQAEFEKNELDRISVIDKELNYLSDHLVDAQSELSRMEGLLRDKFIYASTSGRIQRMRIEKAGKRIAAGAYVLEIAPLSTDFEVSSRINIAEVPSIAEGQIVQVQLSGGLPKPVWVPAQVDKVQKISQNKRLLSIRLSREDLNKRDLLLGDHSLNGLGEQSEAVISIKSENAFLSLQTTFKNLVHKSMNSQDTKI